LQFKADLVSTSDESLRVDGITIDGTWKAGESLPLAAIGVEGVSLPGNFVTRLLQKINPTIASWLSIRQIAFAKGTLTLTGSLALPAISTPIDLNNLTLDLSQTKAVITGIFQQAALAAVDKQAASFEDQLASLGHVKSIQLDQTATTLTPTLDLVFRVIAEPVSNVTLPFRVHLPTLRVESDGTLKDTMISGAIGLLTNAMGNLNLSDSGVENLRPLIDNKLHRYGVSFDAGVNLADVIAVKLRDIVLDRHGLSLPDSFSVAFDEYIPIPPYLAIGKVGGTVWVNPPGKFGVAATLILSIDPEGWIIQVVAGFIGNGPQRTIQVDGNLLIFTIPLFHAKLCGFRERILDDGCGNAGAVILDLGDEDHDRVQQYPHVMWWRQSVAKIPARIIALQEYLRDARTRNICLIRGTPANLTRTRTRRINIIVDTDGLGEHGFIDEPSRLLFLDLDRAAISWRDDLEGAVGCAVARLGEPFASASCVWFLTAGHGDAGTQARGTDRKQFGQDHFQPRGLPTRDRGRSHLLPEERDGYGGLVRQEDR
jgi:hypothetical protein